MYLIQDVSKPLDLFVFNMRWNEGTCRREKIMFPHTCFRTWEKKWANRCAHVLSSPPLPPHSMLSVTSNILSCDRPGQHWMKGEGGTGKCLLVSKARATVWLIFSPTYGIPFGFVHCDTKSCADKFLDLLLMTPTTHLIQKCARHLHTVDLDWGRLFCSSCSAP